MNTQLIFMILCAVFTVAWTAFGTLAYKLQGTQLTECRQEISTLQYESKLHTEKVANENKTAVINNAKIATQVNAVLATDIKTKDCPSAISWMISQAGNL